jgi:hypothetical protein
MVMGLCIYSREESYELEAKGRRPRRKVQHRVLTSFPSRSSKHVLSIFCRRPSRSKAFQKVTASFTFSAASEAAAMVAYGVFYLLHHSQFDH